MAFDFTPGAGRISPGYDPAASQVAAQNQAFTSPLEASRQKTQLEQANIAAQAAMYPATLQQQRFNTVFPWVSGQVFPWVQGQLGKFGQPGTGGGFPGQPPEVTVGGVLNPQQVQQQVNQTKAATDAATQTNIRGMQQRLGGTGMGAQSPLAQALTGQMQGQGLQTNTQNETNLRLQAAQQNAQNLLATQQARLGGWEASGQLANQRLQALLGPENALIAALGGMV
jgi:hypothetical protein